MDTCTVLIDSKYPWVWLMGSGLPTLADDAAKLSPSLVLLDATNDVFKYCIASFTLRVSGKCEQRDFDCSVGQFVFKKVGLSSRIPLQLCYCSYNETCPTQNASTYCAHVLISDKIQQFSLHSTVKRKLRSPTCTGVKKKRRRRRVLLHFEWIWLEWDEIFV